jgi:hypothetical protein
MAGKFTVLLLGRKRICTHCNKPIPKDDYCLAYTAGKGRFAVVANLCQPCVQKIHTEMAGMTAART